MTRVVLGQIVIVASTWLPTIDIPQQQTKIFLPKVHDIIEAGNRLKEAGKLKTCPRVKQHTSEYLHYKMQSCSELRELKATYSRPANSSLASLYPTTSPFGAPFDVHRVGLSEENTGFQPVQEQDVADQCISVLPCDKSTRYRTINGSCNNFIFPMWGVTDSALVRLLPAHYQDGVNKVRKAKSGKDLPNARFLRTKLFVDKDVPDPIHRLNVMQWGQVIAHDTTHVVQQGSEQGGLDCCGSRAQNTPASCLTIKVPKNDVFYSRHKKTCINVVRSMTTNDVGCDLAPHQQIAAVTHFVDGSFVYGSTDETAKALRTFTNGLLKVQQTSDKRDFPPNSKNADSDCDNQGDEKTCYFTGDNRGNQNTGMSVMQIIWLREHNRLCLELQNLNPHWSDEILYQEARRILIAQMQRITFDEYLHIILGKEFLKKMDMIDGQGDEPLSLTGYDKFLNPSSLNCFAAASFRAFHSWITKEIQLFDADLKPLNTLVLDDLFFRPSIIQETGMLDNMLRGLAVQESQKQDQFFTESITNLLFKSNKPFGSDLESVDIQRGRDHGLAVYNEYRVACGFPKARSFKDLIDVMSVKEILKLSSLYEEVGDVDLFVGGMLESPAPGSVVGPTFQCLLGEQFHRWRSGDRFYYDFGNQTGSFTLHQVKEIRKVTLAEIFCNNGDNITKMQADVFHVISDKNPVQPCSSIVKMNLLPWKEKCTKHS